MSAPKRSPVRTILVGTAIVLALMIGLYLQATATTNRIALADAPKPVSTALGRAGTFRATRSYVGTLEPWGLAQVGPQRVSAYVGTVLVRPGALVKRGEVLATLDCRNSSAASQETAAHARAVEQQRNALAHEAARVQQLGEGGFASANEIEQLTAKTAVQTAEIESLKASLLARSLEVDDCILRAPFAGEISDRRYDPGAYVRPGNAVVTVIDRYTIRVTSDVPEADFSVVAPRTPVRIENLAGGAKLMATVSRRAPAADPTTRTVHFECDMANPARELPVGTTAIVSIEVGQPRPATVVPLRAATIRGEQATVFVVERDVAHRKIVAVLGETGGELYLDPALPASAAVVLEGRALLDDGDRVSAREFTAPSGGPSEVRAPAPENAR